jgi:L-ascorbate metabolism protein UlaG (beta-lactamase superfamily)
MRVEWYGQAAFRLSAGDCTVFIDPFADMSGAAPFDTEELPEADGPLVLVPAAP